MPPNMLITSITVQTQVQCTGLSLHLTRWSWLGEPDHSGASTLYFRIMNVSPIPSSSRKNGNISAGFSLLKHSPKQKPQRQQQQDSLVALMTPAPLYTVSPRRSKRSRRNDLDSSFSSNKTTSWGYLDINNELAETAKEQPVSQSRAAVLSKILKELGDEVLTVDTVKKNTKPIKKKVSFQDVTVREYPLMLGDNVANSTTGGPSFSIDWTYTQLPAVNVSVFEMIRLPHRFGRKKLMLTRSARIQRAQRLGYSATEIEQNTRAVQQVRQQRKQTAKYMQVEQRMSEPVKNLLNILLLEQ